MSKSKFHILSTSALANDLIENAAGHQTIIIAIPFIETVVAVDENLRHGIQMLFGRELNVVFTSSKAIEALLPVPTGISWNIYCIGHATKNRAVQYFGENSIKGEADSATTLADIIVQQSINDVTFFCGDKRRDELAAILNEAGIAVNEVVVYKTVETPHKLTDLYDAILFFSPSGVSSFFKANTPDNNCTLFAIGNTTADEIKKHTNNKVVVSDTPSKKLMIEEAIQYLQNHQ